MRKLNKMDDMFDDRDAVVQTSINGVTYDVPEWLSPDI